MSLPEAAAGDLGAPRQPIALRFQVTPRAGEVAALLLRPTGARALLALAHGAGAGMRHAFLEAMAARRAALGLATFRYQFPYIEEGRRRPSPRGLLIATVRAAVFAATERAGDLPLFAGGKSMGGRMTSLTFAGEPLPELRGLFFLGFPLHPAGRPGTERGEHLARVDAPMLFLQGARDKLAELELIRPLCAGLGERAELVIIEGGDHSFHVLKRSGRSDGEVLDELAESLGKWTARLL